jgi:uncharacterized membrane protein
LAATVAGVLAFVPWAVVLLAHLGYVRQSLSWMTEEKSPLGLLDGWCFGVHSVFLDLLPNRGSTLAFALRLPIVLLAVGSVGFLIWKTRPKTWLLPASLIGVMLLATVVPDVVLGGQRSYVPRYALTGYVGILLAVAHLLAAGMASSRQWQRAACQLVLAGMIVGGLASDAFSSRAVRWWNKGQNNTIPAAADVINQSNHPLVFSAFGGEHFGNVIALGRFVEPRTHFWLTSETEMPAIPDGFDDLFLFKPSTVLSKQCEAQGYEVQLTDAPGLCRLQRRETIALSGFGNSVGHPAD